MNSHFFWITVLSCALMGIGVSRASPESLMPFETLTSQSSNIILARLKNFEVGKDDRGLLVGRYTLDSQQPFKGDVLTSPVRVTLLPNSMLVNGFHYAPSNAVYVLLLLKSDQSGNLYYTSNSSDQIYLQPALDRPPASFSDFKSLVKYLLFSSNSKNNSIGLAISRNLQDQDIVERFKYFSEHGTPSQQFFAKQDIAQTIPEEIQTQLSPTLTKIVDDELALWKSRWNASDVQGLTAMIDRGEAPYVGEKSDEAIGDKLNKELKKGPIKNIQILQVTPNGTKIGLYMLYDLNGKQQLGNMLIEIKDNGKPAIENMSFNP